MNAVSPGPIATKALLERLRTRAEGGGLLEKEAMRKYSQTALGRIATAEEVANTTLFLCSALASGITGQSIVVDAGSG